MVNRARLNRLERAIPPADLALLRDGSVVELEPGERMAVLLAVLDDEHRHEHHRLFDLLPRLAEDADPSLRGFAALIAAFDDEDDDEGERREG